MTTWMLHMLVVVPTLVVDIHDMDDDLAAEAKERGADLGQDNWHLQTQTYRVLLMNWLRIGDLMDQVLVLNQLLSQGRMTMSLSLPSLNCPANAILLEETARLVSSGRWRMMLMVDAIGCDDRVVDMVMAATNMKLCTDDRFPGEEGHDTLKDVDVRS